MTTTFTIDRLGAQGDGVANIESGQVFIRFALPGEKVIAFRRKERAELASVIEPSPLRVDPACRHFGTCGGCALQHLEPEAYIGWKRDRVVDALRGLDAPVADIVRCPPATRRRVVFAARKTQSGLLLGYYEAMSHTIMPVEECPITRPRIVDRLADIAALADAASSSTKPFKVMVTDTDAGLDVAVEGGGKLSDAGRRRAAELAAQTGIARLSADGEIVLEPRRPQIRFGAATVEPPPGAFLQATAEAENAMAGLVAGHLAGARRVADLFSGSGTFALRLGSRSEVHAVEADAAALAALERAFRATGGALKRVTHERRDLFRRPLTAKELERFDGLVFDPPRAGAEDQARQIAKSPVPLVAAVSCNPVTLARDLAILVSGGYRVVSVTPIDQFLWSPHVEAVALLEKPRKRR